jgi:hypothetical protein
MFLVLGLDMLADGRMMDCMTTTTDTLEVGGMARLSIIVESNNEALVDDNSDLEVSDLIKWVAGRVYGAGFSAGSGSVTDSNGNIVGSWEWVPGVTEMDNQAELDASVEAHELALAERDDLA